MSFTLPRALSIDEIFDRARDYDYVLTADTPLADALNNRISSPRLGKFAYTPRGLIYDSHSESRTLDRRELFLRLNSELSAPPREILYHLENILHCWQETGRPEEVMNYANYVDHLTEEILSRLQSLGSIYRSLQNFDSPPEGKALIVAPYQFKKLDQNVFPDKYDELDPLQRGEYELPEFHLFSSAEKIVRAVLNSLSVYDPSDVAVVVHPESSYQPLLEAALQAEGIPRTTNRLLDERSSFRTFLELLNLAFSDDVSKVRDLEPLMRRLGYEVDPELKEELVPFLDNPDCHDFERLRQQLRGSNFGQAIETYEDLSGADLGDFKGLLGELNLRHKKIGKELDFLKFYLDNFPPPLPPSGAPGVLFVSPQSLSFVDRPVVFYLGMGVDWDREQHPRPWVDIEDNRQKNLSDFSLLLQNGSRQYYFVRNRERNEPVTPCYYFNALVDETFEEFADFPSRNVSPPEAGPGAGFERHQQPVAAVELDHFSQSSLNTFVSSPRAYLFDRLLPDRDSYYLRKGTLFHDFAEFFLEHSEFVKKRGLEEMCGRALEELRAYMPSYQESAVRTELRLGMESIINYLEAHNLSRERNRNQPKLAKYDRKDENLFASQYDLKLTDPRAEVFFRDDELRVKGKVDLKLSETHLLDYKSGRRQSARSLVRRGNLKFARDRVNFQAILYLAHLRRQNPRTALKFSFFYFLDNLNEVLSGRGSGEAVMETLCYYPRPVAEQVARPETFEFLVENVSESNNRRKTLEKLGEEAYGEFFKQHDFPAGVEREELVETEVYERFLIYCRSKVGEYKYVDSGVKSTFNKLLRMRRENFFWEDLEDFEDYLEEALEKFHYYSRTRFPVEGELEELDIDDLPNRDLLLTGERGGADGTE